MHPLKLAMRALWGQSSPTSKACIQKNEFEVLIKEECIKAYGVQYLSD